MRRIHTFKYYSYGKHSNPLTAQEEVDALREKHPDREYDILINMRSYYKRYVVVQYREVTVDWPDDADLNLPPPPQSPPLNARYSPAAHDQQSWEDYRHEQARRQSIIKKATEPLLKRLHEKLNP